MAEKMTPCPFCGCGLPEITGDGTGTPLWRIKCQDCPGQMVFFSTKSRMEAIEAWNCRAHLAQSAQEKDMNKFTAEEVLDLIEVLRRIAGGALKHRADEDAVILSTQMLLTYADSLEHRESMVTDAARYRWWRDNPEHPSVPYFEDGRWHIPYETSNARGFGGGVGVMSFDTLDDAVDAARATKGGDHG